MTLQDVVQRIQDSQQQAETNPTSALEKNRTLFLDIIRQDCLYIIPEAEISQDALSQKLFRPYIAPAQDGDPRLFLRIFSHKDLAESFITHQGRNQVCELDGVELIQLAKTYFLHGVYGFLLNDGSVWTALSFPVFLTDFYKEILGDESLARPEFISLIQFINEVRQNYFYHIQAGRPTVRDARTKIQLRFTDRPNDIWTADAGDWIYEDCKIEHLMQASGNSDDTLIYIKTAKCDLKIQPAYLRAALCAAGLAEKHTQPDFDFHTDSIALDYRMQDFDLDRLPLQCQLASLPKPDEPEPELTAEAEPECAEPKHHIDFSGVRCKLTSFVQRFFRKNIPQEKTQPDEDVLDIPSDEKTQDDPTQKQTEPVPKKFQINTKLMVKGFFAAAFLLIFVAVMAQILKPSPREELEEAVSAGNYAEVVTLYDACVDRDPGSREELLQMLSADLQASLDAYAADDITANQLADKISAYEKIETLKTKCDSIYDQASALEQSKMAYNNGLIETSMVERLTDWRDVIPADTGSKAAMAEALESNADFYKNMVFEEVQIMDRGSALSALMLLQSYYPDDKDVAERIKSWQKESADQHISSSVGTPPEGTNSEESWPIAVGDIYVEVGNNGYDLHIEWQNKSGKSISQLLFAVTAFDTDGQPVVSTMTNENGETITYSQYIADASGYGPYENGFVMPDNLYWKNAWVTSKNIDRVQLDGIWIMYQDESSDPWTYIRTDSQENTSESNKSDSQKSFEDLLQTGELN